MDVPFFTSRLIKRLPGKLLSMRKLRKLFEYRLTGAVPVRGNTGICSCGRGEDNVKDQYLRGFYKPSSFPSSDNILPRIESRVLRYQMSGLVTLRKVAGPKVRRLTQSE